MSRRVVVVTGASAGVGRATVRAFAEAGDDVGLIARDEQGLSDAAKEVEDGGVRACVAIADVASADEVEAAAKRIEAELGPIDVWVNNAMAAVFSRFTDVEPEEYERVTDVVYLGTVNGTRAALRRMIPRGSGRIVQVGSALAYRGIPLQSAYCGAKHAIQGFTESVRTELMHDKTGVSIGMVHLPAMNTPQFRLARSKMGKQPQPVPPIYAPEQAARAIVWSSEHDRREIWVGGSTVGTILGSRLFPGLLDRYLAKTGFESQMTDKMPEPADNLYEPVPEDQGAHGPFEGELPVHHRSPQLTASLHRNVLAGVAAASAASAGAGAVIRRVVRSSK